MADLRQELKAWERDFVGRHGRKPGREDIKRDPEIEAKYKSYSLANKPSRDNSALHTPSRGQKRKYVVTADVLSEHPKNVPVATPRRAMKSLKESCDVGTENEDYTEPDPTPAFIRCALGPTPQKDGQVLGIFDMLPSVSPSKPGAANPDMGITFNGMTPTRRRTAPEMSTPSVSARTPQSTSKRFLLDAFSAVTPKRKRGNETPSTAKRQFATPSFLRRNFALAPIAEDEHETSLAPPFKKRNLMRSLSSMIRGLRNQEEERLDEELDILNEMEAEERGEKLPPTTSSRPIPQIQVEDSQGPEMPLGPDQAPISDDEAHQADLQGSLDANGMPRKVYKKKGLKRQTKRVNMRPVMHKPRKEGDLMEHSDIEEEFVAETQHVRRLISRESPNISGDSDDELDDEKTKSPSKVKSRKSQSKSDHNAGKEKAPTKKKVNALAHANFRRLKIKNKNSKANGRGRFGRR